MYIYGKPHDPRPGDGGDAEPDSARQEQHRPSSPGPTTRPPQPRLGPPPTPPPPHPPSSSASKPRRSSFPVAFPFPPLFQANTSSTSLAPSTAEGRPIPLDNTTAAHRTSALQKLNSTYPSEARRNRYAKSAGAQSSTYSQPVLVRTYTGLPPSQTSQGRGLRYRPSSGSRGVSRRVPLPASSRQSTVNLSSRPIQPALSGIGTGSASSTNPLTDENGKPADGLNMPRPKSKKSSSKLPLPLPLPLQLPLPWQWQSSSARPDHDEARLPPLEAFSFKSIMADMQTRGDEGGIGADLDRIAEICARSRYSLSNQYEVHVAPHGSGESFATGGRSRRKGHSHVIGGPTLQAFNSDDDESAAARSHRKRRSGGRRKSVAYGTLETIMSSSRSSEEDKTKKKPAAEIASEVRGRASKKDWDSSTGSGSKSASTANLGSSCKDGAALHGGSAKEVPKATLARKKSASFATAVIDSGRSTGRNEAAASLVSEPALPQTSNTNLGVRTTPNAASGGSSSQTSRSASPNQRIEVHLADELPHQDDYKLSSGSLLAWSSWIPWRTQSKGETEGSTHTRDTPSHAEGSLRQLLKSVDLGSDKGRTID